MSTILPFDIIALIIDIVGDNKDINLLTELALVSRSFLQLCSKHLFATVELCDAVPKRHVAFVNLLINRPDVVKHIRKLTYRVGYQSLQLELSHIYPIFDHYNHLLSPNLPNFLRTIPRLNCLTITTSTSLDWNLLNSSLTSAFLHLMHLPTINYIDLSIIRNFPLSSLTSSVNLHRLDLSYMKCLDPEDNSPEIVIQSEMPKILEFHTSESSLLTSKLLHAKRQDGQPAFSFMDLRRLSMSFTYLEDERNIRYLLQNAKLLEKLYLSVGHGRSLVGLHDILSPTLKVFDLAVSLYDVTVPLPLAGLLEELEAMAGHNMLEALSCEVQVEGYETEDYIGLQIRSVIQKVEKVLVKFGWPVLRQVSFNFSIVCRWISREATTKLSEALQSLPDKYLSHLPKHESIAFKYSVKAQVRI